MRFLKRTFQNDQGDSLSARLDLPIDGQPNAYSLFAHCFTCSKSLRAVGHISHALTKRGIAVLRFDFTGLGESEGDFADTDFSSNVADLIAAARFLEREHEAASILIGHSLGGAAVLQAALALHDVRAVATIGAPADPSHVTHLIRSSREEIERTGKAEVLLAGRRFTIKRQFLDDLEEQRMAQAIGSLRRALLVLHSPIDEVVGIENARRIFKLARHPKSFVSLDTADHLLLNEQDAEYVGEVLAAWAVKYLPVEEETTKASPEARGVTVRTGRDRFRTEIRVRGHTVISDEPLAMGGTDLGMTPTELLSASLGACTAITLRMYADRKEWPLEAVGVHVIHDKVKAEGVARPADRLSMVLDFTGPLDQAQTDRLMQIAGRCPVHRTLESDIQIEKVLAEQTLVE